MNSASEKVIVIGAGAAGLMAAAAAAENGVAVVVYEKNEKPGKKIYITGKGRCNFTNACDTADFFGSVIRNPRFLYSSVYGFDASAAMAFFEQNGCPIKVERGNRAFPVSDHASDITRALTDRLKKLGVRIFLNTGAKEILTAETENGKRVSGILLENGQKVEARKVILCTGGLSYPSTGSSGDGHRILAGLGLNMIPTAPSLVPLITAEEWPKRLQGLALKNVAISIRESGEPSGKKKKPLYRDFGEMLFTHFGVSGPIILSASARLLFDQGQQYDLKLDLKPALTEETLLERLDREFAVSPVRQFQTVLRTLFPQRLAEEIALLSGIDASRMVRTITEKEKKEFVSLIKAVPMTLTGNRGFQEAIVTRGGINVRELNPSTMECKRIRGLYAAGELIDVDALTGGYNLQIAWSTGHLAGVSAALQREEKIYE